VRTAGERGAELTQRLLAYSRRQPIQPIALDVNDVLGGLRQLLRRTLRENIEIAIALTEDVRTVFADPVQLELTILGLAVAAQEGMAGGGRLTITTADAANEASGTRLTAPGERLIITIADDGTALPPAARQARITAATAGLPAADVTVDVTPGAGTVVRLSLPAAGLAPSRQAPAEAAPESGRGLVLLAEDDPFVRSYAVTCLESLGFRVVAAVDGPDALARLSQGVEPDILFTDIVMPGGLNGWQLAEKALRVRPGLKVLYTSGYALDTLAEGGHIAPDTRVLNKPYRRAELARHMQELMQDARATA
jgi:CheY-like chemotaxis protein